MADILYSEEDMEKFKHALVKHRLSEEPLDDDSVTQIINESMKTMQLNQDGTPNVLGAGSTNKATGTESSVSHFNLLGEIAEGQITPSKGEVEQWLPPLPNIVTGSNAAEITSQDKHGVAVARRHAEYNMLMPQRGEYAFGNWIQQTYNEIFHKDKLVSVDEATSQFRAAGLDIKTTKPLSQASVNRAIEVENARKVYGDLLSENMRNGGDVGTWNNLLMYGTAIQAGIGPVELISTIVLGIAIPGAAVSGVAKGASLIRNILKLKTVKDATRTINALKNASRVATFSRALGAGAGANAVAKAGEATALVPRVAQAQDVVGAARTLREAAVSARGFSEAKGVGLFKGEVGQRALDDVYRASRSTGKLGKMDSMKVYDDLVNARTPEEARQILQKAISQEQGAVQLESTLDSLSGMSYDSLGIGAKTVADSSAFLGTDLPFIQSKYNESKNLGLGYYTEKDRMIESLTAAFAAPLIMVPARYVKNRFIRPSNALVSGRVNKKFRDIDVNEALGHISSEEAREQREATAKMFMVDLKESEKAYKFIPKQSENLTKIVDELQGMNLSSEDAIAVLRYSLECAETGAPMDLSKLPGNTKMLLSSLDSRVISEGVSNGFENVLKDSLEFTVSETTGVASVAIKAERGLLKGHKFWGLTKQEAINNMNDYYKGFLAGDEEAKLRFVGNAHRLARFIEDGQELLATDTWMHEVNTKAKKGALPESEKISFIDQRMIRQESLMDMYMNLKHPGMIEQYPSAIRVFKQKLDPKNIYKDFASEEDEMFMYGEASLLPDGKPNLEELGQVAQAVADAYNFALKYHNKGTGKGRFVQLQPNFQEYLDELSNAMTDMTYLANSEDYAKVVGSEKMMQVAVDMANGGYKPEDFNKLLLGFNRITSEEFSDITREVSVKRNLVAQSRLEMAKIKGSDGYAEAINSLEKDSYVDATTQSRYLTAVDKVEASNTLLKKGFDDIENTLFTNLTENNESFQKVLSYIDLDNLTDRNVRAVRTFLQNIITDTLSKNQDVTKVLNKNEIRELALRVGANFQKIAKEHPEVIGAFMSQENRLMSTRMGRVPRVQLGKGQTVADVQVDMTAHHGLYTDTASHALGWKKFYTMFQDTVSSRIMDVELQESNNIKIMVNVTDSMRKYPEIASEILTGLNTQTVYSYLGSRASVESASKVASMYITDYYNSLRTTKSTDGISLFDWAKMPENKNEIFEMRSRILHGEAIQNKGNAYQVAKGMVDMESTVKQLFRKYGADYRTYVETVKRDKLRYADSAITPSELSSLTTNSRSSLEALTADSILGRPGVFDGTEFSYGRKKGKIKEGDEVYDDFIKHLGKAKDYGNRLIGLGDEYNNNVTWWMFKNLDLDAMFDKSGRRLISLNEIRDALVNGRDLTELIQGDAYDITELEAGLKQLCDTFRGKRIKTKSGELITTRGVADEFISGFFDLRSTPSGGQVASTRLLNNQLVFRGIDEEIDAMARFGYDSLDEYLRTYMTKMTSALAVLEKMGSSPMDTVDTLINTHNRAIAKDPVLINSILKRREIAFGEGIKGKAAKEQYLEKMSITGGAAKSVEANVRLACGLDNYAPSKLVKLTRVLQMAVSSPLLVSAGLKSFADTGTTVTGLLMNGMAENATDAWGTVLRGIRTMQLNRDIRNMQYGCTVLSGMDIMKAYGGDPLGLAFMSSKQYGNLDKAESVISKFSDIVTNVLGRLESVTNTTKANAAWCISYTTAQNADKEFSKLNKALQSAWKREGLVADDWEFVRKNGVTNMYDLYLENGVKASKLNKSMKNDGMLDVYKLMHLPDEVYAKELERRGVEVITEDVIADFRHGITSKIWAMLDKGSDEMVSIPSGRIQNALHGSYAPGSGVATALNVLTQYQSFGASLVYNNYIKYLAYRTEGETGITVMDLFNPAARLSQQTRADVFKGLAGIWFNIAMPMLVIETGVNAMKGQLQAPIDEKGNIHMDVMGSTLLGSLGIFGTMLESIWGAFEVVGQRRGGGVSFTAAPSISNLGRTIGHLTNPLTSKSVSPDRKAEAVRAASINEIGRFTGLKTSPFTALTWQLLFGAKLDEIARGGRANYNRYIRQRERRGYWVPDFVKHPAVGLEAINNTAEDLSNMLQGN